ncbi:MAG: hypothetical protein AVDCRST_MAG95-3659, partial [uncultured Adhaeribacter sp.]
AITIIAFQLHNTRMVWRNKASAGFLESIY